MSDEEGFAMTFVDLALAFGFVWFVLAIEWPTEEHDHPFHDDNNLPERS